MPNVRFPTPHLPIDVRFAERYLWATEAHRRVRITIDLDADVSTWTSSDGERWERYGGDATITWLADGAVEIDYP